jgi:hypothetical protein
VLNPYRTYGSLARRQKEALSCFPVSHPDSLGAGEIVPVKPDGPKDQSEEAQVACVPTCNSRVTGRMATVCGSASVNSMIGGETEAYCLARRGPLVQSSSPLTMHFLCFRRVHDLSEAALLHTVIYRV